MDLKFGIHNTVKRATAMFVFLSSSFSSIHKIIIFDKKSVKMRKDLTTYTPKSFNAPHG